MADETTTEPRQIADLPAEYTSLWPLPTPKAEPPQPAEKPKFLNMLTPSDIQLIREALANYSLQMRMMRHDDGRKEQFNELLEQFRAYGKDEHLVGVSLTRLFR